MIQQEMPILITGAKGFIAKNLIITLRAHGFQNLLLCDQKTSEEELQEYTSKAAFVFHLAGVNRPENTADFDTHNHLFTKKLTSLLKQAKNSAPILMTSSIQAELENPYGISKRNAEQALFEHEQQMSAPALIYRLPNVFGKWCRPSYNSVVATFCYQIANDLPIEIHDPDKLITFVYIDDLMQLFLEALAGRVKRDRSRFAFCELNCPTYDVTVGQIAQHLTAFHQARNTLSLINQADPFVKKLYATYLSYLPINAFSSPLTMHCDERGSFTEFLRTAEYGQVSVNITKPGVTKGNHWHHTKSEKFLVVQGTAEIQFRRMDDTDVITYVCSGETLEAVDIPTGYTHSIQNVGTTDLITIMWASEPFDPAHPDTFFEPVNP